MANSAHLARLLELRLVEKGFDSVQVAADGRGELRHGHARQRRLLAERARVLEHRKRIDERIGEHLFGDRVAVAVVLEGLFVLAGRRREVILKERD